MAAIKTQRLGSDCVREANTQWLRVEFESITFRDGERVIDFTMRITGLVTSLLSLGDTIDDTKVVQKFQCVSRFA